MLNYLRSDFIPPTDQAALQHNSAVFSHSNFVVQIKFSHKSLYLRPLSPSGGP